MIAVDQNRRRSLPFHRIDNRFFLSKEFWLHSTKLDHQTQQRSDNFLARENQHIGHRPNRQKGASAERQLTDPNHELAYGRYRGYSLGTNVHLTLGITSVR